MKNLYFAILLLITIFCSGFSDSVLNINLSYQPNANRLKTIFQNSLPDSGIIYTIVPRGLIISIDENLFFNKDEVKIKESSLYILDIISCLLNQLSNYCVIENHTEERGQDNTRNWEISIARASNIAEYMIKYRKLPTEKVFSLGFGEIMPFKDNVAPRNGINNRIDFVILEYEVKR